MKTCYLNLLVVEKWLKCSLMTGIALHDYMSVCWNLHVLYQVYMIIFLLGKKEKAFFTPTPPFLIEEVKHAPCKKRKFKSISNEKLVSLLPQTSISFPRENDC